MNKYILKGVTELAHKELDIDDVLDLKSMIGNELTEHNKLSEVDGKRLFNMPNGIETHIDYLIIEKVQPELNFKQDLSSKNEWELAIKHELYLKQEDYENCSLIKKEIDKRISNGTINHGLMSGFRYWNPETKQFEGEPKYNKVNGLFDDYKPEK